MPFSMHNSITVCWFGCFIAVRRTIKLNIYMKDACVLFIVINCLLLEKDGSVSIHHKNIQSLAIEMFQIKHGQSPEIVSDIFTQTTQHYNFRQNRDFRIRSVKSVYHGFESISYLGSKMWEIVPAKTKETNSLNSFKIEIRKWVPQLSL